MQKITSSVVLLLTLLAAQTVLAFYDPSTGRFLSRDPIGEPGFELTRRMPTTPQIGAVAPTPSRWIQRDKAVEENRYTFVANNPISHIDPFGLSLADGTFGGGIGGPLIKFCQAAKDQTCNRAVGANVLLQLRTSGIDGNDDRGGGNAFRHCLATCQSAKQCGEDSARRFWDGRETSGTRAGRQDLANNQVGYGNASQESCWDACMNSWNNGQLTCANGPCPPRNRPAN